MPSSDHQEARSAARALGELLAEHEQMRQALASLSDELLSELGINPRDLEAAAR